MASTNLCGPNVTIPTHGILVTSCLGCDEHKLSGCGWLSHWHGQTDRARSARLPLSRAHPAPSARSLHATFQQNSDPIATACQQLIVRATGLALSCTKPKKTLNSFPSDLTQKQEKSILLQSLIAYGTTQVVDPIIVLPQLRFHLGKVPLWLRFHQS